MNRLSRFDLGMIIAFVIVALLGGGAWYYLSNQLQAAQSDAATAANDFDTYTKKEVYLPTRQNVKTLQASIDAMTAQLDPIVKGKLQSPQSALENIKSVNTVDWKHNLDDEVDKLNTAASTHGIEVPKHFYYGFSRYLRTDPKEEATTVLERQELAIGEVANILINAPVHAIISVRRTYEEDAENERAGSSAAGSDQLPGRSVQAPGNVYTSYPFEFEFDVKSTDAFRKVLNDLTKSNYVFVIRSLMVQNSRLDSPQVRDLDQMAGPAPQPPDNTSISSSPGAVAAAAPPTVGLKYLFGDETILVRARIDLIDWHGIAQPDENGTGPGARGPRRPRNPGNPGFPGNPGNPSNG